MSARPALRHRLKRAGRTAWRGLLMLAAALLLATAALNFWVVQDAKPRLYTNWAALPANDVGLVLGTSPFTRNGSANPHFAGRIAAAAELYQLGKVKHLIVSGANPDARYNEPRRMWQALTDAGVPEQAITMDFAGFRTFDSMARSRLVFELGRVTVITQDYHAYRALFIGTRLGVDAVAYAPAGENPGPAFRPFVREVFARAWAVLDVYLLDTAPKFAGQPIELPREAKKTRLDNPPG